MNMMQNTYTQFDDFALSSLKPLAIRNFMNLLCKKKLQKPKSFHFQLENYNIFLKQNLT